MICYFSKSRPQSLHLYTYSYDYNLSLTELLSFSFLNFSKYDTEPQETGKLAWNIPSELQVLYGEVKYIQIHVWGDLYNEYSRAGSYDS